MNRTEILMDFAKNLKTVVNSLLSNQDLSSLTYLFYHKDTDEVTVTENALQLIASIYKYEKNKHFSKRINS